MRGNISLRRLATSKKYSKYINDVVKVRIDNDEYNEEGYNRHSAIKKKEYIVAKSYRKNKKKHFLPCNMVGLHFLPCDMVV